MNCSLFDHENQPLRSFLQLNRNNKSNTLFQKNSPKSIYCLCRPSLNNNDKQQRTTKMSNEKHNREKTLHFIINLLNNFSLNNAEISCQFNLTNKPNHSFAFHFKTRDVTHVLEMSRTHQLTLSLIFYIFQRLKKEFPEKNTNNVRSTFLCLHSFNSDHSWWCCTFMEFWWKWTGKII